jgi:outer membrane biosynthesis protein TonB
VRWPTGRVPRRHDLLQRLALVAGLVAISALVPTLILLADQQESEPLEELRAFPLQAAVEVAEPDEAEPLPAFTFPTVPELEDPAPGPTEPVGTPTPTPTPSPTPAPATPPPPPPPTPSPTANPGPAPSPTPTSSETDATGGDGDGGDQDGGDGGEAGEETVLPAPPGDPPPGGTVDE